MINRELLLEMVSQGLVSVQKHPTEDLFIYNYSPKVQYDKIWNEATLRARGLILDGEMNIIALPFPKFFNYEEIEDKSVLSGRFDAFQKMDGSLGILYFIGDRPFIATRGSFVSEQAIHATSVLRDRYYFHQFDRDYTYLFEIIYPENRIVVDYGQTDDIVFLTAIHKETGSERFFEMPMPTVNMYRGIYEGISAIDALKSIQATNEEGLVLRFENNFRIKVKYDEYVRLHRILTGVSSKTIWEYLRDGGLPDELLEKIPDEFYKWVKNIQEQICIDYQSIVKDCEAVYAEFPTRKEAAEFFTKQKYPAILFSMLDGKDFSHIIWKLVKPVRSTAFKQDI